MTGLSMYQIPKAIQAHPVFLAELMVLACVSILSAGIGRLPLHFIENAGLVTLFGLNDLYLVACMAYDILRNRRLRPRAAPDWRHLAPIELWASGNAINTQDLWIGDTIRFPSPTVDAVGFTGFRPRN
jgi:uncharacterized membrane protein YfcA